MNNAWQHEPVWFAPIAKLGGGWIAFKDAGSPPAPPDYAGAAQAQGAANLETAQAQGRINNPNVFTPYGSQSVTWGGGTPTLNQGAYDQAMQQYNQQLAQFNSQPAGRWQNDGEGGGEWVGGPTGTAPTAPSQSQFMTGGGADQPTITQTLAPAQQSLLDAQNRISGQLAGVAESGVNRVGQGMSQNFDTSGLPGTQSSVSGGNYQTGVNAPTLAGGYDAGGRQQTSLGNTGNVQQGLDFSGAPGIPGINDFGRERDQVTNALLSRSEPQFQRDEELTRTRLMNQGIAQGAEASNFDMDTLNRARNDARMQATLAGSQEQSRLANLAMAARGQYTGEQAQQGAFANNAQNQMFSQGLAGGNFANAAQQAQNAQNASAAQFGNQAAQQQFGMGQQNATMNNQAQQQMFQQGLANANLGNQARQTGIQEQAYLRSLPLNELNALRTGSQVNNPQFQPYQGATVGQTPVFGAAQAQGQADANIYNAQAGQANSFNSGLASLGGTAMMAMAF